MRIDRQDPSGRALAWILLTVALLSLAGGLLYFLIRPRPVGQDEGQTRAEQFLDQLRAGQIEPAWNGTTAEFKSLMGLEALRDYVRTHRALAAPARLVSFEMTSNNGLELARYAFEAQSKPPAPIEVLLARENGEWKVERLSANASSPAKTTP